MVYGVKVHTSETKESPAKIFVGGRKSLAWVGRWVLIPFETQNNRYINPDNWLFSWLGFGLLELYCTSIYLLTVHHFKCWMKHIQHIRKLFWRQKQIDYQKKQMTDALWNVPWHQFIGNTKDSRFLWKEHLVPIEVD
jgi:hypothetical protein